MVFAAIVGIGLGLTGGIMLGGQLFKDHSTTEEGKYRHLDLHADEDDQIPEPVVTGTIAPEYRQILKFAPKWTTWPDFEQVRWMNSTIEWLWPHLSKAVTKMAKEIVEPILKDVVEKQALLDAVVVERLDLGTLPLRLAGLKVYNTKDDEVILEAPVQWGSNLQVHVSACIRVGPASIFVPLKVEDVQVAATARVTLRPLVDQLPCLGAVAITLVEAPFVDLTVKAINDWDLVSLPGVDAAIAFAVKKAAEQVCVYPNQIHVPLMENSGLPTPPCGMLELTVVRAANLVSSDFIGKGDPYVKLAVQKRGKLGEDAEEDAVLLEGPSHQTSIKHGDKNPEFKEHFKILVNDLGPGHYLAFKVLDWDRLGADELAAVYDLPLDPNAPDSEFLRDTSEEATMTVDLEHPPGSAIRAERGRKGAGQLTFSVQYTPFFNAGGGDEVGEDDDPARAMERLAAQKKARMISDSSKGVLTVSIARAMDLPTIGPTCDSYVQLRLLDPDSAEEPETRRTQLVMNETSPRYRATFDFVYVSATSVLYLTVFDHPGTWETSNVVRLGQKADEALGKVRVHVKDVARIGRLKDSFPLQEADQGDLHMALSWTPVERDD